MTALLAELTAEAGRSASDNPVDIAIAGGFVASSVLSRVDSDDDAERPAWERVRVWWADERYVAADSPDRNDAEAIEGLFARTPGVDLHPMPTNEGQSIQEAAQACLEEWQSHMEGRQIDVAVLGMGPDGHFASLFPGHSTLDGTDDVLLEEDSPKPPPARLTLSREVLTSARHIWVIAGGASKAEALGRASYLGGVCTGLGMVASEKDDVVELLNDLERRAILARIEQALLDPVNQAG